MPRQTIISLLRPQNKRVVSLLKDALRCDVATFPNSPPVSESSNAEGLRRAGSIAQVLPHMVAGYAGLNFMDRDAIVQTIAGPLAQRMSSTIAMIDSLEALRARAPIQAVLANETGLHESRTAVLWARAHSIPSYVISNRSNLGEPATVTRKMLADLVCVFGERSTHPYLDMGVPQDRIAVTGNPAWDHYASVLERRGHYRSQTFAQLKLRSGAPLLVFATTWNGHLSALQEAAIYEQTMRAFIRGVVALRAGGGAFNVVIKDFPERIKAGRPIVARFAREEGLDDYTYPEGDEPLYLCAADLLVGYDATVFVEAMMAGVPAVNLWCPSSWLTGPAMDQRDGIPLVLHDDTDGLAAIMRRLLIDPNAKQRQILRQGQRFAHFHATADGKSSERCANIIIERLSKRR